jgi:hypothetical protein
MKKILPFFLLTFCLSACSFQINTSSNSSSENKTSNNSSSSETVKNNSNAVSNEIKSPVNIEKPKVENKPETKIHEDLHKTDVTENSEDSEGDDENGREIVKFAKGKTSATYEYGLVRGERRTYVVEAKKGQTMAVRIEAEENNAVFNITKNGKIIDTAEETDKWVGTLPSDGKYEIEVGGTRGNASYIIEISVEN